VRVRTINPELYSDETLGDLEPRTPLPVFRTFVGLISYADREGRFRWSPRAIRGALAPCWDGDMGATLDALASAGLLVRYSVDGESYGYIPLHGRYTTVHPKETASTLPEESRDSGEQPGAPGGAPPFRELPEASRDSGNSLSDQLRSSLLNSDPSDPDPDQPDQVGSAPASTGATPLQREPLPHELAERRATAEPTGARPALRFEFRPEWKPKTTHRDLARSLGLTDEEVGERLHDCRNKTYPTGFRSEDKQFNRELAWAARDKETRTFKAQQLAARKANPHGFDENPGARRRPDDPRPEPVFGRISAG
jgi:hypothetical protein